MCVQVKAGGLVNRPAAVQELGSERRDNGSLDQRAESFDHDCSQDYFSDEK